MERWVMIHFAQGWQLAVERGPGWLFVRPYNPLQHEGGPFQLDDELTGAADSLARPTIGAAGEETLVDADAAVGVAEVEICLADQVWQLLEQNFTRRVVLELDQVGCLTSQLVGQLASLQDRVVAEGGLIRICGLSSANQAVLGQCGLLGRFVCYDTRPDAVMGYRPPRPR
jgi:anti-anti-sigma regulatory factor